MEGGGYHPMLLPVTFLILQWLGQLSSILPIGVLIGFGISFWREAFRRSSTLLSIAMAQCAFTTIYALYATWLLGSEWLH